VLAGTAAIVLSGGAMVGVMGIAGPAVQQGHASTAVLGATMAAHFVGMFGLAPVVGRVADKVGRRMVIVGGLALTAAGGLAIALLPGPGGFAASLLAIGLGWSLSYLGASVLLVDVTPLARRARVLGRADLLGALCQAALAALAGVWFAERGAAGVGIAAAALLVLPLLLVALAVREPRPGVYAQPAAA
jgi:MFS family permease